MSDVTLFVGKGSRVVMPASFVADHALPVDECVAPAVRSAAHAVQADRVNALSEEGAVVRTALPSPTDARSTVAEAARGERSPKVGGRLGELSEAVELSAASPKGENESIRGATTESASTEASKRGAPAVPAEQQRDTSDVTSAPQRPRQDGSAMPGSSRSHAGGGMSVPRDVLDAGMSCWTLRSRRASPQRQQDMLVKRWYLVRGQRVLVAFQRHVPRIVC